MSLLAATLFAQLVVVGGDPAACKAQVKKGAMIVRPTGDMSVRTLLQIMAKNDCVRYLVPAHLLELRLSFGPSMQLVKDWRGPVRSALEGVGIKLRDEQLLVVEGPPAPKALLEEEMDAGITCASPGHCTIKRTLLDKVLDNQASLASSARIVPSLHDGKPDGFRLFAIHADSWWARLGFENGDTMQSFNGFDITSPDKALEAYSKLREATNIVVRIVRRGEPKTLEYQIR